MIRGRLGVHNCRRLHCCHSLAIDRHLAGAGAGGKTNLVGRCTRCGHGDHDRGHGDHDVMIFMLLVVFIATITLMFMVIVIVISISTSSESINRWSICSDRCSRCWLKPTNQIRKYPSDRKNHRNGLKVPVSNHIDQATAEGKLLILLCSRNGFSLGDGREQGQSDEEKAGRCWSRRMHR